MNTHAHLGPAPNCTPDAAGHCITCSDEGVPMRVIETGADIGLALCADEQGRQTEVMTALVGAVAPGDTLLVHAGTALLRLDEKPLTPRPPRVGEGGPGLRGGGNGPRENAA